MRIMRAGIFVREFGFEERAGLLPAKEVLQKSLLRGDVTKALENLGAWAGHVREAADALRQVAELVREGLVAAAPCEGEGPEGAQRFGMNPLLLLDLLRTPEFQRLAAVIFVRLLRS